MGTASSRYEDTVTLSNKIKTRDPKSTSLHDEDYYVDHEDFDQAAEDDIGDQSNLKQRSMSAKVPKIEVDQIDEEQARQDLMAYLEIVGDNADDLPMTWRDDPELGATVSTLTAKQYAAKSDAFIPCDVRVIASTCTKYGNLNKGLPNKENFYLGERAQEPGLSQGGAISNSLLKVIYDFENDEAKVTTGNDNVDMYANENLFDDDDDDNDNNFDEDEDCFGELEFDGMMSGKQLSWVELLRRMKDEMEDLDYAQVPTLSTSRRLDLNDPVYLLPETFNPETNRKFSLLIGCNYKREVGALQKCHDDIHMVKDYIVNVFGFPEDEQYMTVLLDDKKHKKPTYKNILQAMKFIALRSRPGDAVFIQFSGHGGRVKDLGTRTADCYDEVLVPCDFEKRGFITDKVIFKTLLVPMAEDVTVTMILDSCDTGIMLDMPYAWGTKDDDGGTKAKLKLNDCFSFMRFLNVVKQLYDTSLTNGEDLDDSDADSIATMGDGNDDSDEEYETKKKKKGKNELFGFSTKDLMKTINTTMKIIEDEAEHAGNTAMKVYDLVMDQAEERVKQRSRGSKRSDVGLEEDETRDSQLSSYDTYESYDSFYSDDESEDSYYAERSRKDYSRRSNQRSRHSKSRW